MQARYIYLKKDGKQGLRVAGRPASGTQVSVQRIDGSTTLEVVGEVVWTGEDKEVPNGIVSLCTIATKRASPAGSVVEDLKGIRTSIDDLITRLCQ